MTNFVCILTDAQNRPVGVTVINSPTPATTATISPYVFETDDAARTYQRQLLEHYGLPSPQRVKPGKARHRVKCNQTGEIFPTAAAAARAHGITTSAMTRHLREPHIHRTIAGRFTFGRIDENGNMEFR